MMSHSLHAKYLKFNHQRLQVGMEKPWSFVVVLVILIGWGWQFLLAGQDRIGFNSSFGVMSVDKVDNLHLMSNLRQENQRQAISELNDAWPVYRGWLANPWLELLQDSSFRLCVGSGALTLLGWLRQAGSSLEYTVGIYLTLNWMVK